MNIHYIIESFSIYFRKRRIKLFYNIFNITKSTKILDVGGNLIFWKFARDMGLVVPEITVLNLYAETNEIPKNFMWILADCRQLPFINKSFDICFCNSLIEHLIDRESQITLAKEIRRVASNYFIQTPSYIFPVDQHLYTPFIHWLPNNIQLLLIRNFTLRGLVQKPSNEECKSLVYNTHLLRKNEIRNLFPNANVLKETY